MRWVEIVVQLLLVPLVAPLGVGLINGIKAKLQNRRGPSPLQPYRNLWKLFHKDEVISRDASWIFRAAPYIVFGSILLVGASIPLFGIGLHSATSDVLAIVYILAIGTFFLALAGMDTGSAFGGFGSSREMTLSALAEGALVVSVVPLVLVSGSTDLFAIVQFVASHIQQLSTPLALGFAAFIVVLLAEAKRYPFDNPDTHLELTMVHEAMLLEYSGKRLALMEWAAFSKLFVFSALAVNLFWPVGLVHQASLGAMALGICILLAKVLVVYAGIAVLESVIAKFRFFRLPDLLFVSIILSIIAIGLVI